jgi:hypothetical protein
MLQYKYTDGDFRLNLSEDQRDELMSFFDSEAYKALNAAMSQIIQKQAEGALAAGNEQLHEERAKYQGMLQLRQWIGKLRDELLGKQAKPK